MLASLVARSDAKSEGLPVCRWISNMTPRLRFRSMAGQLAFLGFLLGCGAPFGHILFSYASHAESGMSLFSWANLVWLRYSDMLIYASVPAILVFSVFGCVAGRMMDRLAFREQQMKELLNIAAHDIRGPVSVMKSAIEILSEEIREQVNEEQAEILEMIARQSEVVAELATEILDVGRFEEHRGNIDHLPVELHELVSRAIRETEILVKNKSGRINFSYRIDGPVFVDGDSIRLRQVIRNLIGNAAKYMFPASEVEVLLEPGADGEVKLSVSNDGPHIPTEKIEVIFDKFVQSSIRDYKLGHGLGLTICKHIVEEHRGRIWAENVPGKGVRMNVILPR